MIKIKKYNSPLLVRPADMNVGAVGIIRNWSVKSYVGKVVMKVKEDYLICLDPAVHACNGGWAHLDFFSDHEFQVEVLPKGVVIEITL